MSLQFITRVFFVASVIMYLLLLFIIARLLFLDAKVESKKSEAQVDISEPESQETQRGADSSHEDIKDLQNKNLPTP